jgi:putative chitinase
MEPAVLADCTGSTMANAIRYAEHLTQAMDQFQINTPNRQAAFLATCAIEAQNLSKVEESLYYKDPVRLAKIYPRVFKNSEQASPYTRNPDALGQLLYGGYWGRGLLMLTWEKNYRDAGAALGYDYLNNADMLLDPEHASLTAAWFFATNGCNAKADEGDMTGVTRIVNGPALMHLKERIEQYEKNLEILS